MDFVVDWIKGLFTRFLRFTLPGYQNRMKSLVRRNTVGRLEAKMHSAQGRLDQKVFKAQDRLMGPAGATRRPSAQGPTAPGPAAAPGRNPSSPTRNN